MKKFNAGEWVLLMFAGSVCLVIIISVLGIVFKGNSSPNEGAVQTRAAILDLLKIIAGGVLGAVSAFKTMKDDNNNRTS